MQETVTPRPSGNSSLGTVKRRKDSLGVESFPPGAGVIVRTKEDIPEVLEVVSVSAFQLPLIVCHESSCLVAAGVKTVASSIHCTCCPNGSSSSLGRRITCMHGRLHLSSFKGIEKALLGPERGLSGYSACCSTKRSQIGAPRGH